MSKGPLLIVSFPVDLGNRAYESNLREIFGELPGISWFRFAAQDADGIDRGINYRRNLFWRFADCLRLRREIRRIQKCGGKVLFHNVSPAFFSYGSWRKEQTYILLDWTRRLYPRVLGYKCHEPLQPLHAITLRSASKVLCVTDASAQSVIEDYGINSRSVFRVPAPLNIDPYQGEVRPVSIPPKVLFIGGDIRRKGGDLLHEVFVRKLHRSCRLTMVTNADLESCAGLEIRKGVKSGTAEHAELIRSQDILVLPTRIDSYPMAVAEAAAAGLAIVTTRFALGAPDVVKPGINGYIAESPEECVRIAGELVNEPEKIFQMKQASAAHMKQHFSKERIRRSYLNAMNESDLTAENGREAS